LPLSAAFSGGVVERRRDGRCDHDYNCNE
jgi:hypothetical protein